MKKYFNGNEVKIDQVLFKKIVEFINEIIQIDESLLENYKIFCSDQGIEKELMERRIKIFYKAKD